MRHQSVQGGFGFNGPVVHRNDDASVFFRLVFESFQRAADACGGSIEHTYLIGGCAVRLCFAGPALVPSITPALAHVSADPYGCPELTVFLWDSTSSGVKMPPPPWGRDCYGPKGEIRGYNNDRFRTIVQMDSGILSFIDFETKRALYWIHDARDIPSYENGAPLLRIFNAWTMKRGFQLVHGGAVGVSNGGVLLAGRGGSGKSTTALQCLHRGFHYAGDDYVLLKVDDAPVVYSLYCTGKVHSDNLKRLGFLLPLVSNKEKINTEKALFFLHDRYPYTIRTSFPVRAIVVPCISGRPDSRLKPVSRSVGLKALAPSTLFQLPGTGGETFRLLAEFTRRVPCYLLELGSDPSPVPHLIEQALLGS